MLKSKPKEKKSIYHHSFHQHKKRSSLSKWALLFFSLTCATLFYINTSHAFDLSKKYDLEDIGSGQLLFKLAKNENASLYAKQDNYQAAVLVNSAASFDINGLITTVTLTQSFINQSDQTLNGLYAFPLPENSAVNYLQVQVGNRVIEGKIMEKAQAKKVFEQAKRSGKKASLLRQHRPNLFTNDIANIAANEQITVTIKYIQHVDYINGQFSLRFPMKITPRYQTILERPALLANFSSQTSTHQTLSHHINLTVKLNAGVDLLDVTSPSHKIQINKHAQAPLTSLTSTEILNISVGNVQVPMDKDFVLQWQPTLSTEPRLSVFKQMINGEHYALAMILPPTNEALLPESISPITLEYKVNNPQTFARDITFIIDTSGSMQGASIKQAKQSLRFALQTLSQRDSFNIIAFESSSTQAFSSTVMATTKNLAIAKQFISTLVADGGTEMYRPLADALAMPTVDSLERQAIKQVIFITDGAVSNELALFKLIHNTPHIPRLFTVGIGSAPNGYFMRKAAQFGRGSYTYISKTNEVQQKMSTLLEKISKPALRNIALQFQPLHLGSIEQYPQKIPDLYYGEPLVVAFKTKLMPTNIQVFGEQADQNWQQEVELLTQQESVGITSIWARAKIENLLDGLITGKNPDTVKKQVLATSLLHQVISPYSSFIAVEQAEKTDVDDVKQQKVPFPVTATAWQQQLIIGLLLLILSWLIKSISIRKNEKR
ncbi:MAG: marine proteobacterial sortase target protein [Colwellia sp.]